MAKDIKVWSQEGYIMDALRKLTKFTTSCVKMDSFEAMAKLKFEPVSHSIVFDSKLNHRPFLQIFGVCRELEFEGDEPFKVQMSDTDMSVVSFYWKFDDSDLKGLIDNGFYSGQFDFDSDFYKKLSEVAVPVKSRIDVYAVQLSNSSDEKKLLLAEPVNINNNLMSYELCGFDLSDFFVKQGDAKKGLESYMETPEVDEEYVKEDEKETVVESTLRQEEEAKVESEASTETKAPTLSPEMQQRAEKLQSEIDKNIKTADGGNVSGAFDVEVTSEDLPTYDNIDKPPVNEEEEDERKKRQAAVDTNMAAQIYESSAKVVAHGYDDFSPAD